MKIIFFAASFNKRDEFKQIYLAITDAGFSVSSPIYDYQANTDIDYATLMNYDFQQIDACDIVLADVTYKEIGVGIEIGYAKAKSKSIVYIHRKGSELSTTVLGTTNMHIEYDESNYTTKVVEYVCKEFGL